MTLAPSSAGQPTPVVHGRGVIAVASGKGGVGKTWFAVTLAQALAECAQPVLLFDGDLGLANVDVQLGLIPERDLGQVVARRITLNQAAVPYPAGGFDIVAGASGSGGLASLTPPQLDGLASDLMRLTAAYRWTVLDLGAGVDYTVRSLAVRSQTCLVLTTDEPTALTDAYAFIKLLLQNSPSSRSRPPRIEIVVNLATSIVEGERTYNAIAKACAAFLKTTPELAGIIRRDERVRDAIRSQAPLLTRHPNSEAAADVRALVRRLTPRDK